jgi:translation initiation factor IF-3
VPEVRLVGEDGKQIGVVKTSEALAYAQERDLDLVEVAPEARPPVCRVLDYSKYKYEQAQKQKAARKHQQQITIREIKFRPKIAQNDYDTKKGHVTRFLLGKDKVKITIMFRGREVTHPERGTALLDKLSSELAEIAVIEQSPLQDGRNMTMMLAPSKAVLAGERDKDKASPDGSDATSAPDGQATAAPDGDATPAPDGEVTAAPDGEASAEPDSGATTPPHGDATAAPEDDATAAPEDDATAAPEDEATAAPESEATPGADGEAKPGTDGEAKPVAEREARPAPSAQRGKRATAERT